MFCLEIIINGKKNGVVGYEGAEHYGVSISINPIINNELCFIDANGAFPSEEIYSDGLKWFKESLREGDEISIKIVESDNPDSPTITKHQEGVYNNCTDPMLCSNCGVSQFDTGKFISGKKVFLCEKCMLGFTDFIND